MKKPVFDRKVEASIYDLANKNLENKIVHGWMYKLVVNLLLGKQANREIIFCIQT